MRKELFPRSRGMSLHSRYICRHQHPQKVSEVAKAIFRRTSTVVSPSALPCTGLGLLQSMGIRPISRTGLDIRVRPFSLSHVKFHNLIRREHSISCHNEIIESL